MVEPDECETEETIGRQAARITELEAALRPYVCWSGYWLMREPDAPDNAIVEAEPDNCLTFGDLRRAVELVK